MLWDHVGHDLPPVAFPRAAETIKSQSGGSRNISNCTGADTIIEVVPEPFQAFARTWRAVEQALVARIPERRPRQTRTESRSAGSYAFRTAREPSALSCKGRARQGTGPGDGGVPAGPGACVAGASA